MSSRGQRRLLGEVNDVDVVAIREVLHAERRQVRESSQRLGRLTRDIQAQPPDLIGADDGRVRPAERVHEAPTGMSRAVAACLA
jgi:hypothetical protein